MFQMSFGIVSILVGVFLPTCYYISIKTKQFKGWIKREEAQETKYRHNIIIPVLFVLGLIFGSMLQPFVDSFNECKQNNSASKNKNCIIYSIYNQR